MDLKTNIYTNVDRAINEFRSGRPIIVKNGVENWVFFTVENLNIKILNQLTKGSEKKIFTYITNNKANNLNIKKKNYKGCFSFPFRIKDTKLLMSMHTKKLNKFEKNKFDKNYYNKCPNFINYIMNLAKNAKTIPCLIGSLIDPKLVSHSVMVFDYRNLKNQNKIITQSTKMVSKSNIPLVKNHKAIIMVFKSFVGGLEHIVLQIGKPNKQKSINLRIQSACLTGEVFHSIKCDCNEQLHQSINYISKNGGGYIIHLEQEGRGIGLANKIKAYDMQNLKCQI